MARPKPADAPVTKMLMIASVVLDCSI